MSAKRKTRDFMSTMAVIIGFLGLTLLQYWALQKQVKMGITPGIIAFDLSGVQTHFQMVKNEASIPITGYSENTQAVVVRYENFSNGYSDFENVNGLFNLDGHELIFSPRTYVKGAFAIWGQRGSSLPEKFIFAADILSPMSNSQKFGLALNIRRDHSALVFLIDPAEKKYSLGYWDGLLYHALVDWSDSEAVLGMLSTNRLMVECSQNEVSFIINGTVEEKVSLEEACNQGKLGVFILAPTWFISIDNPTLSYYK